MNIKMRLGLKVVKWKSGGLFISAEQTVKSPLVEVKKKDASERVCI